MKEIKETIVQQLDKDEAFETKFNQLREKEKLLKKLNSPKVPTISNHRRDQSFEVESSVAQTVRNSNKRQVFWDE